MTLSPTLVSITAGVPSQGALAGAVWDVGTLAPGAQATILLTVSAPTAGTAQVTANAVTTTVTDPLSAADNSATASISVANPTVALTATSLSRSVFRVQGVRLQNRRTKVKAGTTLRLTLNVPARLTVQVQRKVGARYRNAGSFAFTAPAGRRSRVWNGRLRRKALRPGSYRLVVRATAAGTTTAPRRVTFRILAP